MKPKISQLMRPRHLVTVQHVADRVIHAWRRAAGRSLSMEVFFKIICDHTADITNKQIDRQLYRAKLHLKSKSITREDIEAAGTLEGLKDTYKVFFSYLWRFMETIVRTKQR